MATYKVPQDVEADDKLIGPFTFRQFIYLIIVTLAIGLAFFLGGIFLPFATIPLPIIILFGALALPLRKDQPMETYLAAILSFYLKPRTRLWDPDGIDEPIEIATPKDTTGPAIKGLSEQEAEQRLGYLANLIDTRGWSIRGATVQSPDSSLNSDVYYEAQQTLDVLDDSNVTSMIIKDKLDKSTANHRQALVEQMSQQTTTQAPKQKPESLTYNPYPNIKQAVVQPLEPDNQVSSAKPPVNQSATSAKPISAGIINLASNNDLSIETIAREANRISQKQDEVIISLR